MVEFTRTLHVPMTLSTPPRPDPRRDPMAVTGPDA